MSAFMQSFAATGFIGPLLLLAGCAGLAVFVGRMRALRMAALAPPPLVDSLRSSLKRRDVERALDEASANRSYLGQIVSAALLLHGAGEDEMLANLERVAARESLGSGNRIAHLVRIGVLVVLLGLLGTVLALISASAMLRRLKDPTPADFAGAIGDALGNAALGLLISALLFAGFYFLDHRLTRRSLATIGIAEDLLRSLPRMNNPGS
jgi:biopolymer transport protein ExbB/TolQ